MAKTYIRIYCNDVKIRSTGNESWYRKHVLDELMLDKDLNFSITTDDKRCERLRNRLESYATNYVFSNGETKTYKYSVELVRANTFGKKILKTVYLPWVLIDEGKFFCDLDEGLEREEVDNIDKDT